MKMGDKVKARKMVSHWCFEVAPRIPFPSFQRRAQVSDLSLMKMIVIVAMKMRIMIVVVITSLILMTIKNNAIVS